MPTTSALKPVDFKPLWQQMEALPAASSALCAFTTAEDWSDNSIFVINGSTFLEYFTDGNLPQKRASPIIAPVGFVSIRYSKFWGNRGRVISAPSSTTLRIAGLNWGIFKNQAIKITHGTGAGQKRNITIAPEATTYDQWVATTGTTSAIGDSTKKWKFNQWAGYQVRFTVGSGQTLIRKILYNDTTTVYWADTNYQAIDSWNNSVLTATPSTTAGSQTHFIIEATDITIDSAWDIPPDTTSRFLIDSGSVWLLSQAAAAPFYTLQYYDRASDVWQQKTASANLILSAFGTDGSIERTGEVGWIYKTGTATGGGTYTLTDSVLTGVVADQYRNYRIRITAWTGIGQNRRIIANTTTSFEVARKWQITPDITSQYEVLADKDKIYFAGNSQATLFHYDVDDDLPIQWWKIDAGIATNMSLTMPGIEQPIVIWVTSATKQASDTSVTAVNTTPIAAGANYLVGDILTLATGTGGKVIVESINVTGWVTSVSLLSPGTVGYSVATFATTGGTGTWCTILVTSVGRVGAIVTAINHPFEKWDSVIFGWATESAWNTTYTVLGVDSLTTVFFVITSTATAVPIASNSATVIVDSSKNWIVNEHAGKIVQTHLAWVTGAMTPRVIISNTANSLTVATITTGLVNGTGRYAITEIQALGRDEQFRVENKWGNGTATWGSTTTLVDSTKNWIVNQWAGARLRIIGGTGRNVVAVGFVIITSNTETTLNYTAPGFTADATTKYIIEDTFGTCTGAGSTATIVDTTKKWATNQFAGKRVRITGGAGFGLTAALNEFSIISNTNNTLTFAPITGFAPDATTTYTILGNPVSGAWIQLVWLSGGISQGRHIFRPRGSGSNTVDRYSIITEKYEYGALHSPQTEVFNAGTYYAYDGENRIYFAPTVASGLVQYVMYYDIELNRTFWLAPAPNTQLWPVIGNRMEIAKSPAWTSYLYINRNSGAEIYRTPIFF